MNNFGCQWHLPHNHSSSVLLNFEQFSFDGTLFATRSSSSCNNQCSATTLWMWKCSFCANRTWREYVRHKTRTHNMYDSLSQDRYWQIQSVWWVNTRIVSRTSDRHSAHIGGNLSQCTDLLGLSQGHWKSMTGKSEQCVMSVTWKRKDGSVTRVSHHQGKWQKWRNVVLSHEWCLFKFKNHFPLPFSDGNCALSVAHCSFLTIAPFDTSFLGARVSCTVEENSVVSTAFTVISSLLALLYSYFGTSTSSMQLFVPRQSIIQEFCPERFGEGISISNPQGSIILTDCCTGPIKILYGIAPRTVEPTSCRGRETFSAFLCGTSKTIIHVWMSFVILSFLNMVPKSCYFTDSSNPILFLQ